MKIIISVLIGISLICQLSCNKKNEKRELIVLLGCDETEVVSDIQYSIQKLTDYFATNHIIVTTKYDTTECGYILKYNQEEFHIESALTDADLLEEIEKVFKSEI